MYKNKYIKYKNKYLSLQKQLNQKGGSRLISNKDEIVQLYNDTRPTAFNDASKLYFLMIKNSIGPINILVGATCTNDTDYLRFKNSDIYSLYIDMESPLYIITEEYKDKIIDRQYHMFTIAYTDLVSAKNLLSKQNINFKCNEIHFDKNVSYSASINYLEIANRFLTQGGHIIWDIGQQHQADITYLYKPDNNNFMSRIDGTMKTIEYLNDTYFLNIDVPTKTFTLREGFFENNKIISPQLSINLTYEEDGATFQFIGDTTVGYVNYLTAKYPSITFEEKIYSYTNYAYPVPIRFIDENYTINVWDDFLNYVFNKIMIVEEIKNYIDDRYISDGFLEEILRRITSSHVEAILDIIRETELSIIETYLYSAFKKEYKFIEGTKKIEDV